MAHELHISITRFVDDNRTFFKALISGNLDHGVCNQFNDLRQSADRALTQFETAKSFAALKSKLSDEPSSLHVLQRVATAHSLETHRTGIATLLENSEHQTVQTFRDLMDDYHMSRIAGGTTEIVEQLNGELDDLRDFFVTHKAARNLTHVSTQMLVALTPQINLEHKQSFVSNIGSFTESPPANTSPSPSEPLKPR